MRTALGTIGVLTLASAASATPLAVPRATWDFTRLEFHPLYPAANVSAVNARGQVVGRLPSKSGGGGPTHMDGALVWDAAGAVTPLPSANADAGYTSLYADDINDDGVIIGGSSFNGYPFTPTAWLPQADGSYVTTVAPTVGADYGVNPWLGLAALNNAGLSASIGTHTAPGTGTYLGSTGYRWQVGEPTLGARVGSWADVPGSYGDLTDLADDGTGVGMAMNPPGTSPSFHAAIWAPGAVVPELLPTPTDIPTDDVLPWAIADDGGLIAGEVRSYDGSAFRIRPVAWDADRELIDLVGPGGETGLDLYGVTRDAEGGIIVGAYDPDPTVYGDTRGVIWFDPLNGGPATLVDDLLGPDAEGWTIRSVSAVAAGREGRYDVLHLAGIAFNPAVDHSVYGVPFRLTRRTLAAATFRPVDAGVAFGPGAADVAFAVVPEPAGAALLGLVGGFALRRRRPTLAA